ncbi:MAG TPA: hypothetical protein VKZ84_07680 [Bacteriovoracaceae bacterium]|nr:hypothetical protein [Bacteriovoracaceae bacterium]
MKLVALILMMVSFQAFATQVDTECIAQSENREKIIKTDIKSKKPSSSSAVKG